MSKTATREYILRKQEDYIGDLDRCRLPELQVPQDHDRKDPGGLVEATVRASESGLGGPAHERFDDGARFEGASAAASAQTLPGPTVASSMPAAERHGEALGVRTFDERGWASPTPPPALGVFFT